MWAISHRGEPVLWSDNWYALIWSPFINYFTFTCYILWNRNLLFVNRIQTTSAPQMTHKNVSKVNSNIILVSFQPQPKLIMHKPFSIKIPSKTKCNHTLYMYEKFQETFQSLLIFRLHEKIPLYIFWAFLSIF